MTRGKRTPLDDAERAAIVADYEAGLGINRLRTKYRCGQARIIATIEAAGVERLRHPEAARFKRGRPRRDVVARARGLGREPTALEWGYLAGIFDAEGYLGHASRGDYYRLAIVQKIDTSLLERLCALLRAGRVGNERTGPHRDVGAFHLEAQRSIFEFCRGVLPFVFVKRTRVVEALARCRDLYGWEVDDPPQ